MSDPVVEVTSNSPNWQVYPTLETSENVTHAAWITRGSGWDGPTDLFYSRSINDGSSWSPPQRMNDVAGKVYALSKQFQPSIAVDGDDVYIVWISKQSNPQKIVFSNSSNGGQTWSTEKVAYSFTGNQNGGFPSAEIDGLGVLHVVWQNSYGSFSESLAGPRNLWAVSTSDSGATWTNAVIVDVYNLLHRTDISVHGSHCAPLLICLPAAT